MVQPKHIGLPFQSKLDLSVVIEFDRSLEEGSDLELFLLSLQKDGLVCYILEDEGRDLYL